MIDTQKLIVFTGGGTGGHVFPGLAVIEELRNMGCTRFLWIGSKGGMEEALVLRAGITYRGIPSGKLRRYFSLRNFTDLFNILAGYFQARRILKKEKPALLFSKGGFVSVPPVYAARSLGIPVMAHESDLDPGLATRLTAGSAKILFAPYRKTADRMAAKYGDKVVLSGNPVRTIFRNGNRDKGRAYLGVPDGLPLVAVLGGSSGAGQINDLLSPLLEELTKSCFIVHQMGDRNYKASSLNNYYPAPFFNEELADILAASDLAISRAGAGALWELAVTRTPSILIPLGSATSRGDQIRNAEIFRDGGMAVILDSNTVTSEILKETVIGILNSTDKRERMIKGAEGLASVDGAGLIAREIFKVL